MKYTEQDLIEEFHRVSQENCDGEVPKQKHMREFGCISPATYCNRFGSWKDAVIKAGFNPERYIDYSKEDLQKEMCRVSKEHCGGETPTKREMKQYGEISESTYYRIFGSWNEAVKQCGFKVNEVYSKTDREYEREELVSELRRLSEEYREGGSPRYIDVVQHSDIQQRVFINEFGSWNKALKDSGFSVNIYFRNKKEIKEEMKNLSSKLDKTPTAKQFYNETGIPDALVQEKFGKWNEFIEECGLKKNMRYGISKSKLLEEIKRLHDENDQVPTIDLLNKESEYSVSPFERIFGSWNEAIKSAGLEPQPQIASGEEHAQWRGGVSDVWYGPSWSKRRKEVFNRDDGACRICEKAEGRIEVHHITPKRFWIVEKEHEKMNHPRNLITLCKQCHAKLESCFKARNHNRFEELAKESLNT